MKNAEAQKPEMLLIVQRDSRGQHIVGRTDRGKIGHPVYWYAQDGAVESGICYTSSFYPVDINTLPYISVPGHLNP